jgi:hypothetical protein
LRRRREYMGQGGFGRFVAVGLLLTAALVWGSCGTSNDQGVSFRALAWIVPDETGEVDLEDPSFDQGTTIDLGCTQGVTGKLVVLENVLLQGINVQRIDLGYRIPGGALNLPATAFPVSVRLGPSSGSESDVPLLGAPRAAVRADPLSPQQMEFLSQNQNKLPQRPFRIIVLATGIGVADSGDVFETNELTYPIDVVDDEAFCGPGVVPSTTPGGGGTPVPSPTGTPIPITTP